MLVSWLERGLVYTYEEQVCTNVGLDALLILSCQVLMSAFLDCLTISAQCCAGMSGMIGKN